MVSVQFCDSTVRPTAGGWSRRRQRVGDHAQTRIPLTARPVHGDLGNGLKPKATPSTPPAEAAPYLCRSGGSADQERAIEQIDRCRDCTLGDVRDCWDTD